MRVMINAFKRRVDRRNPAQINLVLLRSLAWATCTAGIYLARWIRSPTRRDHDHKTGKKQNKPSASGRARNSGHAGRIYSRYSATLSYLGQKGMVWPILFSR
jgi:hypothetical protein